MKCAVAICGSLLLTTLAIVHGQSISSDTAAKQRLGTTVDPDLYEPVKPPEAWIGQWRTTTGYLEIYRVAKKEGAGFVMGDFYKDAPSGGFTKGTRIVNGKFRNSNSMLIATGYESSAPSKWKKRQAIYLNLSGYGVNRVIHGWRWTVQKDIYQDEEFKTISTPKQK